MKRFWSIVLFLAVALLVAVIVVSLWGPAPPRPITPLGIRFVSLAQGRTGMPVGECIVSNSNDRTICFWAAGAQVRSGGLWPDKLVLPPVRYTELAAKRTVHLTFVYPRDAVAWRLPIFWFMKPPLKETVP